jgi:hypothetical protein
MNYTRINNHCKYICILDYSFGVLHFLFFNFIMAREQYRNKTNHYRVTKKKELK